jgi:regulator of replication initiation timing
LTLENECQTLEQQLKDHQYSIDSFKNNFELISNENEQLKQQFNELQETNDLLMNNNQNLKYQLERPSSPFVSQENFKQIRRTPTQEVS